MQLSKVLKLSSFAVVSLLVVTLWMVYHKNGGPSTPETAYKGLLVYDSESTRLLDMLRQVSTPDRSFIVTVVNQTWARPQSIFDLFLDSFRTGEGTNYLLNHLMVIAADDEAFRYCTTVHPHCFVHKNRRRRGSNPINPDGPDLAWDVKELLMEVIELGYSVIFTEADVMWLKSPLKHLNPYRELSIACDRQENHRADGGFFYMRSNAISLEVLKMLNFKRVLHPASRDQSFCKIIRHEDFIQEVGFSIHYLSEANFGGFCNPSLDLDKATTVHANCCDDNNSKIHDLKLLLKNRSNVMAADSSMLSGSTSKCMG